MTSPETSSTATCARCHRAIAEGQRVEHRGAIYCLDCVGRSLNGQAAARSAGDRSPGVAVVLSLLPGLGQMYNGQVFKGVVVLVVFLLLATGAGPFSWDRSGINTALLVTLYFWNLFDAHWTAQRVNRARVVWAPWYEPPAAASPSAPAWGALLIVFGILFLLNNFGATWLTWDRLWPVALLALGIWLLISFALQRRSVQWNEPPPEQPPAMSPGQRGAIVQADAPPVSPAGNDSAASKGPEPSFPASSPVTAEPAASQPSEPPSEVDHG